MSGAGLAQVLLQRNPELDVHLVSGADVYPLDQPGHDHVFALNVGLVEAFRPGKQLVDFSLCRFQC